MAAASWQPSDEDGKRIDEFEERMRRVLASQGLACRETYANLGMGSAPRALMVVAFGSARSALEAVRRLDPAAGARGLAAFVGRAKHHRLVALTDDAALRRMLAGLADREPGFAEGILQFGAVQAGVLWLIEVIYNGRDDCQKLALLSPFLATTAAAAIGDATAACLHCGARAQTAGADLMWCGRCRLVRYCSRACQLAHWPTHKPQCRGATARDAKSASSSPSATASAASPVASGASSTSAREAVGSFPAPAQGSSPVSSAP